MKRKRITIESLNKAYEEQQKKTLADFAEQLDIAAFTASLKEAGEELLKEKA